VVTIVGYYRVISTWWFHDDWVFLANAAGIASRATGLVRFVSYKFYWDTMYSLWGTNTLPYAISRLVVHIICAVFVIKIAKQLGINRFGQALAGALFAASPVAFESLYWGTGISEQLGALFSVVCVYLLLSKIRWRFTIAFVFVILAIFSKESGYFLPVLWGYGIYKNNKVSFGSIIAFCTLVGCLVISVWAIKVDLAGSGDYPLSIISIPRNFFVYGFWLVAPVQLMRGLELNSVFAVFIGTVFWSGWGWAAIRAQKNGQLIPLYLLVFTILPLLPATLLDDHAVPRYLYSSLVGLSLSVSWVVANSFSGRYMRSMTPLVLLLALYAHTSTAYRFDGRWTNGTAIHRLVLKENLSRRVFQALRGSDGRGVHKVVFLDPEPDSFVSQDLLRAAVGDDLGVRLMLGDDFDVKFVAKVGDRDHGARVVKIGSGGEVLFGYY